MKEWLRRQWHLFGKHMTQCIVVFSFTIVILFTVIDIRLQMDGIALSDTLIEWVYKFFGLELLALSGIKVSKNIGSAFGRMEEIIDGTASSEEDAAG